MKEASLVCLIAGMLGALTCLVGCATVEQQKAQYTENLLFAAGFTMKAATTPEEQSKLQALTPLKLVKGTKDGQVIYVYADPYNCKCAYVGGENQYEQYRRLVEEQQAAQPPSVPFEELMQDPELSPVGALW